MTSTFQHILVQSLAAKHKFKHTHIHTCYLPLCVFHMELTVELTRCQNPETNSLFSICMYTSPNVHSLTSMSHLMI